MAMGRKRDEQQEAWVATTDLPRSPGHPFYQKLNELLAEHGFDKWIEDLCRPYYAARLGRPSIPPGVYFRMILIGYFEGIGTQRGIAWRCSDSRSLADFLGYGPTEATPDHSSMSRVHGRLPENIHVAVFQFVLGIAEATGILSGKTTAVDSTMLDANAAMKSIVRKENGQDWKEFLRELAEEEGMEDPTDEDLRRFDRGRKNKKVGNREWKSPTDEDSRIARMKDGRTHLAYKAEHVVDVESDLLLAAEVLHADESDGDTFCESLRVAQRNLEAAGATTRIEEAAADKGYHKASALEESVESGIRTYIPEPRRHHQSRWGNKSADRKRAVVNNRRRTRREKGRRLQRLRSELTERSFAHVCETGGARRSWLRGLEKVRKRYQIQAAAKNLSVILRHLFGIGTPRSLQGGGGFGSEALWGFLTTIRSLLESFRTFRTHLSPPSAYKMTGPILFALAVAA